MEPTGMNLSQSHEVSKKDNDIGGGCLAMHDNNNSHSLSRLRDNETLTDKDKETNLRDKIKHKDEYSEGSRGDETLTMKPEQNDEEGGNEDPTTANQSYVVKLRKRPTTIESVDNGYKRMSDSSLFAKKYSFPTSEDFTVSNSGDADTVRITGYLEKRSKMLGWKKFWCVLDGRLLTYYKSKVDYDSLVACSGSINLGIASTVRPVKIRGCKGFPIQIVTRTQVYYLRSQDKQILEQWLIAIQEAASSQPKISFPIWADPGSQFFRYSFAASSQWSLDASNENITESLSNLPLNFYLKKDTHKQTLKSNLQKCHSFASLQAPTTYNSGFQKDTIRDSSNTSVHQRNKKGPAPPPPQNYKSNPIRHSVSMLMLDSSPAAAELKKELTRKLSGENKSPNNNCTKPSSLNNKQKNELPFLIKSSTPDLESGGSHHYDEIVDFEAIYENMSEDDTSSTSTRRTSNISSEQNDTGIYESVDAMNDSWSKLDTDLKTGQSKASLNHKASVESGRTFSTSADEAKSHIDAIRNFPLMPDSETSRTFQTNANMDSDTSSCTSYADSMTQGDKLKTKPKKKHFSNFFNKIFNKDKSKKALKVQTSNMVITGPVDLRSLHQQSQPTAMTRPTNLPIDKVNTSPDTVIKPPPIIGASSPLVNPTVIEELRKKVGQISRSGSPADSGNSLNRSLRRNGSLRKLKDKILNNGNDSMTTLKETKQALSQIVDRSSEKDLANSKGDNIGGNSTLTKPLISPSEEKDDFEVELRSATVGRSSEDFQQKLAKFNRLSQTLNSSFVAALNPPPLAYSTLGPMARSKSFRSGVKTTNANDDPPLLPPKKKAVREQLEYNAYDTPLNNRPISKTSYKDDTELRPKVVEDASIAFFIRSLNKKNSAPEIMFAGLPELMPNVSQQNDKIEAEKVFKEICSVPPPIPPKPSSSPTSGKSITSRFTRPNVQRSGQPNADEKLTKTTNQTSSNIQKVSKLFEQDRNNAASTGLEIAQPISNPQSMNAEISPSISHKSADFLENLEILSDLSDTNISITPPGSPKRNQSSALQTPNDDQDSLMSIHTADSSLRFTEDSLSNTPESLNKGDIKNQLQIFILGDNKKTPEGIKSGESALIYARQNNDDSKDSLELSSINSQSNSENEKFYENLRFATVDTIIQEFETVEETEDEISEMYDDFPTEFLAPVNLSGLSDQDESSSPPTSLSSSQSSPSKNSINEGSFADPRHSGIDQLQEYLNMEMNSKKPEFNEHDETISMIPPFKKSLRQGAVSRLGHSSAVDQLQRVLRTRNDI